MRTVKTIIIIVIAAAAGAVLLFCMAADAARRGLGRMMRGRDV